LEDNMDSEETKVKQPRGNPRIAELGKATRFRPGQSGNPGGRPNRTPYADAHREVADLPVSKLGILPNESTRMGIAKAVVRQALKGNIAAAIEAANRAEGTPRKCPETELTREILIRIVEEKRGRRSDEQTSDLLSPSKTASGAK
jgi:hypothetical protein